MKNNRKINNKPTKKKIWVIGDTHFRSYFMPEYFYKVTGTRISVHDYENEVKKRWNKTVSHGDTVFIVGDYSDNPHTLKDDRRILSSLRGDKTLIGGNHDSGFIDKESKKLRSMDPTIDNTYWLEVGFHRVLDELTINVSGIDVILSHYKIEDVPPGSINVHGHTHDRYESLAGTRFFNAAASVNDFKPISLFEIVEKYRKTLIWSPS